MKSVVSFNSFWNLHRLIHFSIRMGIVEFEFCIQINGARCWNWILLLPHYCHEYLWHLGKLLLLKLWQYSRLNLPRRPVLQHLQWQFFLPLCNPAVFSCQGVISIVRRAISRSCFLLMLTQYSGCTCLIDPGDRRMEWLFICCLSSSSASTTFLLTAEYTCSFGGGTFGLSPLEMRLLEN